MATKNKEATKYYSNIQEERVAKELHGRRASQSGGNKFYKGDVRINGKVSMAIECKTALEDKNSISIKKEWFDKLKEECFEERVKHPVIAFNFGPNDKQDKFIIDYKLMKFLIEKLDEVEDE